MCQYNICTLDLSGQQDLKLCGSGSAQQGQRNSIVVPAQPVGYMHIATMPETMKRYSGAPRRHWNNYEILCSWEEAHAPVVKQVAICPHKVRPWIQEQELESTQIAEHLET